MSPSIIPNRKQKVLALSYPVFVDEEYMRDFTSKFDLDVYNMLSSLLSMHTYRNTARQEKWHLHTDPNCE